MIFSWCIHYNSMRVADVAKCIKSRMISLSSVTSKKRVLPRKPYRTEEELAKTFIDHKFLKVVGGKGGDGRSSFLREKYRPFGGPDGGNGGNGGDVIFIADRNVKSLEKLKSVYCAPDGVDGGGTNCYGRNGKNMIVKCPVGTYFTTEDGEIVSDLNSVGTTFVGAHGGLGGKGNRFFVTNTNTTPEECTPGEPGETRHLVAELRTLAHVGLIGFPNAGKSTLLRALTRAKPQIGEYQFTTLRPHVGILHYEDFSQIAIADIPGIIEGAHDNFGLGLRFLRHVERCRILIFLVDISGPADAWKQIVVLRKELENYKQDILLKPSIYVANKIDLPEATDNLEIFRIQFREFFGNDERLLVISGKRTTNLENLVNAIKSTYDRDLEQHKDETDAIVW